VTRSTAPDDGRGVVLELTGAGRRAVEQQREARQAKFAALLDRVPDNQRAAVVAALHALAEAADDRT
jgi:DNA-binding MarR family transcriptional regulator